MQFVPSLPPPIKPGPSEEAGEVNGPAAVKKVEDVLERPASTPLPHRPRHLPASEPLAGAPPPESSEKRRADASPSERRVFCRRIKEDPLLAGLRSQKDRRRNTQRRDDPMEHVDVEA